MKRVLDYRSRALLILAAAEVGPGDVVEATVAHDPECPALRGQRCTCVPHVSASINGRRWTVDADGFVRVERQQ